MSSATPTNGGADDEQARRDAEILRDVRPMTPADFEQLKRDRPELWAAWKKGRGPVWWDWIRRRWLHIRWTVQRRQWDDAQYAEYLRDHATVADAIRRRDSAALRENLNEAGLAVKRPRGFAGFARRDMLRAGFTEAQIAEIMAMLVNLSRDGGKGGRSVAQFGRFHDALHAAIMAVERVLDASERSPLYEPAMNAIGLARRQPQPPNGARFEIFLGSAYDDVAKAKPLTDDDAIRRLLGEARTKLKMVVGDLHRIEPHGPEEPV